MIRSPVLVSASLLTLLATACVDNGDEPPDREAPDVSLPDVQEPDTPPDGEVGPAPICGAPDPTPRPQTGLSNCLLIHSSDWANNGSLAVLDLDTHEIETDLTDYHQDATIRILDGEVYVLNRMYGDSIMRLDPDNRYAVLWEHSLRPASSSDLPNPHDLVGHGDFLYAALYNTGEVVQLHRYPGAGPDVQFHTGVKVTLPTPTWDGAFAEVTALTVIDDTLYAMTQGLGDDWRCAFPEAHGRIYAYSLPDLSPANVFDGTNVLALNHCNPGGWTTLPDGRLLIHAVGEYRLYGYFENNGGLEVVDLCEARNDGIVADEMDTSLDGTNGRDIFFARRGHDDRLYAAVVDEHFDSAITIVEVLPAEDGARWSFGPSLFQGYLWDLFPWQDRLYIAERHSSREAVVVVDRQTGEELGDAIQTGFPPERLVYFQRRGGCW